LTVKDQMKVVGLVTVATTVISIAPFVAFVTFNKVSEKLAARKDKKTDKKNLKKVA